MKTIVYFKKSFILFLVLILIGCSADSSPGNSYNMYSLCTTLIDDNTEIPIPNGRLQVTYKQDGRDSVAFGNGDENGRVCVSILAGSYTINSWSATANGYRAKAGSGNIPDIIRLEPLAD